MTDKVLADADGNELFDTWRPARVVVGVDGTVANRTAVDWALKEARGRACPLVLLGVGSAETPPSAPRTENLESEHIQRMTLDMLEAVRDGLLLTGVDVRVEVESGEPSHALVHSTDEHDLVVVGKRGGNPLVRTVLGSTSIATVGRVRGPVVVVPEHWSADEHLGQAVVAGLREMSDQTVLRTAFAWAHHLAVGLVVVRSWDMPPSFGRSPDDVEARGKVEQEALDACLAPWRSSFPDVVVETRCQPLAPAVALFGEESRAQLLVLGRHTSPTHHGGLSLGSTTRRVLHHARCPVLVVPEVSDPRVRPDLVPDETDVPEY